MPPVVSIIVAVGPSGVIGSENQMPWHLPRDLRFFRKMTQGNAVIMGRRTFESLGKRPLPKRRNVVISRNANYVARGCEVATSLTGALEICSNEERIFVIGGGEIYRQSLPLADEVYVTEINDENPNLNLFPPFSGDTYFPALEESEWNLVREGKRWFIAANRMPPLPNSRLKRSGMRFRFMVYRRKRDTNS